MNFKQFLKEGITILKEPTVAEVKNLKLIDYEQEIVKIVANLAKHNERYKYRGTVLNNIRNNYELYSLVETNMGAFIKKNKFMDVDKFIISAFLQPYISKKVLYELVYSNPEISLDDITGLIDTGAASLNRGKNAKLHLMHRLKESGQNINTSYIFYMHFPHAYETNYKIAEIFLKYAILKELGNTNYLVDSRMGKETKKHFGDILSAL